MNETKKSSIFNQKAFGDRLSQLRKSKGYTQEKMGELLDIDGKSYGKYEQYTALPSCRTLIKLVELLEVSLDELLFGRSHSPAEKIANLLGAYDEAVQNIIVSIVENSLSLLSSLHTH